MVQVALVLLQVLGSLGAGAAIDSFDRLVPITDPPLDSRAWLRPTVGVEMGLSRLVLRWEDSSGVAKALAPGGASSRPYWDVCGINGLPAVHFDGNDELQRSSGMPTSSYTKAILLRRSAGPRASLMAREGGHELALRSDGHVELVHAGSAFAVSGSPVALHEPTLILATFDVTTGTGKIYLDGRLVGAGATSDENTDPSLRVGASFRGWIGTVLVYDRVLGFWERVQLARHVERVHALDASAPAVSLTAAPRDGEVLQRDGANTATLRVEGEVLDAGYDEVILTTLRDGVPWSTRSELLSPTPPMTFSLEAPIVTSLADYGLRLELVRGLESVLVAERVNVACGDLFLVQGQSNAVAADYHGEGLAGELESHWIRSFGTAGQADLAFDLHWDRAEAEERNVHASVGAWATCLGAKIVQDHEVPVAFLNGALGWSPIAEHLPTAGDPLDLATLYGRLLYRATEAGVADSVRAIFWYQGEADNSMPSSYPGAFDALRSAWISDYPGIERIFSFQIRSGCGFFGAGVREFQRILPQLYPDARTMSTTAAPGHDGCHFTHEGYSELGVRMARLVAQELYGLPAANSEAPNVVEAAYVSPARDRITLTFHPKGDTLVWEEGAEDDVFFDDPSTRVNQVVPSGNAVMLTLSSPSTATTITYAGHALDGPWIRNINGVGALTFFDFPILDAAED